MKIIINNTTGQVLYASAIDVNITKDQQIIEVGNDFFYDFENGFYNFETKEFYEKEL